MDGTIADFGIAVGIASAICYGLIIRAQNQRRRRARASGGGAEGLATNDNMGIASWFSPVGSALDSSGNPIDGGSCSLGSDSGGDCGGGADGGGGGSD